MKMQPPVKRDFLSNNLSGQITQPALQNVPVTNPVEISSEVVNNPPPDPTPDEDEEIIVSADESNLDSEQLQVVKVAKQELVDIRKELQLKNPGGRPSAITEVVVVKLVAAFQSGMDTNTACQYAGIDRSTLFRNMKRNAEFRNIIADAKNNLVLAAGTKLKDILENGSHRDAGPLVKWYLERKLPETYGESKIEPKNNTFIVITHESIRELFKQRSTIEGSNPSELLKSVEIQSEGSVDLSAEEAGFA